MAVPKKISELVALFHSKKDELTEASYKEFSLQTDFLNSLFAELGWDIKNRAGLSEASRDVIQQYALRVGLTTTAPDYSFGIGHERKFIVEAKKPSVDLKHDAVPAMQARSYGWNAGLPIAILTDFEEFAVYDCRIRPRKADKSTTARIFYCTYEEYAERWEEISGIFSREAVVRGDFDTFANTKTKHRGTDTVDDALLKDIDEWRRLLATNIAIRNEALTEEQVNYAVQKIIDRILFLRICEDRGIEQWGILLGQTNGTGIYERMLEQFRHADQRYNSGLFHFHEESGISESPDTVTPALTIDDKILKQIIVSLYPPESPYNFAVLPAEILGQVYEQFLGKVIRLTAGHHAKVEEKPEVRKAGGVYYTPAYIVEYIVEKTVGKLLEGETPKQAAKLTIVDPACGSGSFLLGAYQRLLDWHLEYYAAHTAEKRKKEIYKAKSGDWKLTTAERKRILLANIYGVDIDAQAVEVTKLSLLLKVLEGEDEETLGKQLNMFKERVLPSLSDNIQCGNSLIGSDFSDGAQPSLLGDEEPRNINPFDWEHAFPAIFDNGGFDAVIGNPPYIQLSMADYFNQEVNDYLSVKFSSSMGRLNTFGLFTEMSLKKLVKESGFLSFIVPNTILTQEYYQELRLLMLENNLRNLTNFTYPVFKGAVVETIIFLLQKNKPRNKGQTEIVEFDNKNWKLTSKKIPQFLFRETHANAFLVNLTENNLSFKKKIETATISLGNLTNINQAIALKQDRSAALDSIKIAENYKPVIDGREINRYSLEWKGNYLDYDVNKIHSCKRTDIFEASEKIFFRRVGDCIIATIDKDRFYALNTLIVVTCKTDATMNLRYYLALMNSKLLNYYYNYFLKSTKKVFSEIQARQMAQLPVRIIDFKNPFDRTRHDHIVTLVDRMLDLHKRLASAKTPHEQDQLKRQISATDHEIDELVFDLYGLTKEEKEIVLQAA